jgi:alkylation response protein AidB-like acyl-CoA dehydrogenase
MDLALSGVAVAAVSFGIAFGVARMIVAVARRRRRGREEAAVHATQSRQVRRAHARKNTR